MLLERLESGFLLLETPQGLVPVELSPWQRAYLLWTFRNFRRLSLPLLNSRQASMVRAIAEKHAGCITRSYDPSLVIGVVESFKLPTVAVGASAEPKLDLSPAARAAIKNEAPQTIDPRSLGEQTVARSKEPSQEPQSEIAVQPKIAWLKIAWLKAAWTRVGLLKLERPRLMSFRPTWPRPAWFNHELPSLQLFRRKWIRFEWLKPTWSALSPSRLATAAGVLFLCIGSLIAWHRMGAVAGSEAHSRPNRTESITQVESTLPNAIELRKTSVVENSSGIVSSLPKAVAAPESSSLALPSRAPAAVDIVKPAAAIAAVPPVRERPLPAQNAVKAPEIGSDIQATRPPLRSWYPDFSGVEARGVVVLVADVDSEGAVRSVRVVRGNRALAAAAVRAVRRWRYAPYLEDGEPVATETNIVISVFSEDAISMSFPPSVAVSH